MTLDWVAIRRELNTIPFVNRKRSVFIGTVSDLMPHGTAWSDFSLDVSQREIDEDLEAMAILCGEAEIRDLSITHGNNRLYVTEADYR